MLRLNSKCLLWCVFTATGRPDLKIQHVLIHHRPSAPFNLCQCGSTSGGNWIGELTLPDTSQAPLIFIETWAIDTEIAFDSQGLCLLSCWKTQSIPDWRWRRLVVELHTNAWYYYENQEDGKWIWLFWKWKKQN